MNHKRNVLKRARAKIAQGWTQGAAARLRDGTAAGSADPDAASWCAMGAIYCSAVEMLPYNEAMCADAAAFGALGRSLGFPSIPEWNDAEGRTKAEVLAAFDAAISAA